MTTERLTFNAGATHVGLPRFRRPAAEEAVKEAVLVIVEAGRDWAYLGLLAFTLLLFLRPQDQFPAFGWFRPTELAAIGALAALVSGRLSRHKPVTKVTPELVGLVALGAWILATAPFSIWPGGSVEVLTDLYVKVFLIFVLMLNTLTSPKRLEQFTWVIVISAGYVALGSAIGYFRGEDLVRGTRAAGSVGGIFRNPNDLALNMVSLLPLAIFLALGRGRTLWRAVAAGIALLMLMTTFFTMSRSGFLGLVSMLLTVGFYACRARPGLIGAGMVALVLAMPLVPSSYWARMSSIVEPELDDNGAREARKTVMTEAWHTFLDHPFTGVGAGQFKNYSPPGRQETAKVTHNVLLQVAAELGVLGLGIFVFLMARGFGATRGARRLAGARAAPAVAVAERGGPDGPPAQVSAPPPFLPEERDLLFRHADALAACFVGWFVCAMFASVAFNWTFYYLLGLAVAGREIARDRLTSVRRGERVIRV